jgi:capsular polysaccharide biosynthesis protein
LSVDLAFQGRRLLWCLRHYAWVVLTCILACAAIPLILAPAAPDYQASALVVTRQLATDSQVLPQLAESVFTDGAVEAAVAADSAVGVGTTHLIPNRVSLVAAQDSVVLIVQARDRDPAIAARLANVAADAYVDELNRGGAGVGDFAVQAPAVVPSAPLSALPSYTGAALGGLAGAVLGLGLVALIGAVRKPVVTAGDVQDSTGVPLLGTVQLPAAQAGEYPGPLGVSGIPSLTRWLAAAPPGRLLFISPQTAVALRQRLYVMVAVALSPLRTLRFDGPPALVEAIEEHRLELRRAGRVVHPAVGTDDELVLCDGGSPLDLIDPAVSRVSVVAVAPVGVSQRRIRGLTADYVDNGLLGIVLVEGRVGSPRAADRRPRGSVAPSAPGRSPHGPTGGVEEPERA